MEGLLDRAIRADIAMRLKRGDTIVMEGPRASGKSTVLRLLSDHLEQIVDLTEPAVRSAASDDPVGFLESLKAPAAIDEAQLVPGLASAVKQLLDRPGGWGPAILTGSSPVGRSELGGSDPLVGRATRLRLRPLTRREINGHTDSIVDQWFGTDPPSLSTEPLDRDDYLELALRSGYPAARDLSSADAENWIADTYINGVIPRALDDENRRVSPRLLMTVLASLSAAPASELNYSAFGRRLEISRHTVENHTGLLGELGLIDEVPGWRPGAAKRHVSRPKIHPADGAFTGWATGGELDDAELGGALESMVYRELATQCDIGGRFAIHHWRHRNHEVDFVLEHRRRFVAIEVKAARSLREGITGGIKAFADEVGDRFVRGIVLYTGESVAPLGPNITAAPISALWTTPAQ